MIMTNIGGWSRKNLKKFKTGMSVIRAREKCLSEESEQDYLEDEDEVVIKK